MHHCDWLLDQTFRQGVWVSFRGPRGNTYNVSCTRLGTREVWGEAPGVSLWLHEFEMACDSRPWVALIGWVECKGGVILRVAHPDQMRGDLSSRQRGEDAGPVGNSSLQWDYLKGLFKQTVEFCMLRPQLLTQWV